MKSGCPRKCRPTRSTCTAIWPISAARWAPSKACRRGRRIRPRPSPPRRPPAGGDLVKRYGCTACHAVDARLVGPSFREVAARYGRDGSRPAVPDAEARLIAKLKSRRRRGLGRRTDARSTPGRRRGRADDRPVGPGGGAVDSYGGAERSAWRARMIHAPATRSLPLPRRRRRIGVIHALTGDRCTRPATAPRTTIDRI